MDRLVFTYLLAYVLWIGAIALGVLDAMLLRAVVNQWYIALHLPPHIYRSIDRFYIFSAGAVLLFLVIYLEGTFRQSVDEGRLKAYSVAVYSRGAGLAAILALLLGAVQVYLRIIG